MKRVIILSPCAAIWALLDFERYSWHCWQSGSPCYCSEVKKERGAIREEGKEERSQSKGERRRLTGFDPYSCLKGILTGRGCKNKNDLKQKCVAHFNTSEQEAVWIQKKSTLHLTKCSKVLSLCLSFLINRNRAVVLLFCRSNDTSEEALLSPGDRAKRDGSLGRPLESCGKLSIEQNAMSSLCRTLMALGMDGKISGQQKAHRGPCFPPVWIFVCVCVGGGTCVHTAGVRNLGYWPNFLVDITTFHCIVLLFFSLVPYSDWNWTNRPKIILTAYNCCSPAGAQSHWFPLCTCQRLR